MCASVSAHCVLVQRGSACVRLNQTHAGVRQAYGLHTPGGASGTDYGAQVIDTLVEQIQLEDGADRAVIMMGYRNKARNAALRRRPDHSSFKSA